MCDKGKDNFFLGGALRIFLAENGAAGQISLRNTVINVVYKIGVTRCILLMVLSLDRMYQGELHVVHWSHIGTLMHRVAAEPCSTAGLLFTSRVPLERSC